MRFSRADAAQKMLVKLIWHGQKSKLSRLKGWRGEKGRAGSSASRARLLADQEVD